MKQYRKKPVTIEAVQFDGLNPTEIKDFVGENCEVEIYNNGVTPPVARIVIHTLEGDMEVSKGDYVIKGVKGEFYPCKPDIFQQTYEFAETQKELEEAAYKYSFDSRPSIYGQVDVIDAFKAGAEWQASQMPMPEDTVLFQKGVAEGRRLEKEDIMKDAVEADVNTYKDPVLNCGWAEFVVDMPSVETDKFGDKVHIVVLKEEEK